MHRNHTLPRPRPPTASSKARGLRNDEEVIQLWLDGANPVTRATYAPEIIRFRNTVKKPLASVTVMDIRSFMDGL